MFGLKSKDMRTASFVLLDALDEHPTAVGRSAESLNTFLKQESSESKLSQTIGSRLHAATEPPSKPSVSFSPFQALTVQTAPAPAVSKQVEAKPALFGGIFGRTQMSESSDVRSKADARTTENSVSKIASIQGFVSKWTGKLRVESKAQEKAKKRIAEKIEFKPPSSDYYDNLPVKPGLLFFQTIAKHCNQAVLNVNIPDMIIIYHVITWLFTENGRVRARKEFELKDFVNAVGPGNEACSAVMRITNERGYGPRVVCLNWTEFNEKVNKLNFPQFGSFQRFVQTAGGQIVTIRLFYRTRGKASKAYSIKLPANSSRFSLSTEFGVSRLEVTELSSLIVSSLSQITQRIISFMQNHYFIRFNTIVLDFMKDANGVIWLINCKGFLCDLSVSQARIRRVMSASHLDPKQRAAKSSSEDQLNSMHCKLCLLPFRPNELDKVLPFKMLLEYKHHATLNDRTMMDLSHLRASTIDNLSHTLRVCEVCFMLVVSECELLKVEEKMAKILRIPVKEVDLMRDPDVFQPNFMPAKMHQWRILVHFIEMELSPIQGKDPNWWLQYEFLGVVFSHKIGEHLVELHNHTFELCFTRLHYFFAAMGATAKENCKQQKLKVRLTYGEKWSSVILEGCVSPLSNFAFDFSTSQAFVTTQTVLLFSDTFEQGTVTIKIGISLDKTVKAKTLPISIRRFGALYIPEETYITSQPLPEVWMELFAPCENSRTEILSSRDEVERLYDPVVDISEELEQLNKIHPPKTTPELQRLRTNSLARPKSQSTQKLSISVVSAQDFPLHPRTLSKAKSRTPSPHSVSVIRPGREESGHEDTFSELRILQGEESSLADVSGEIATGVARFLTKRCSSSKTLRMLKRAESVGSMATQQVATMSTLPSEPAASTFYVSFGNSSVELMRRPQSKQRIRHRKSDCDCEKAADRSAAELQLMSKARKALNMSRVYGGLQV